MKEYRYEIFDAILQMCKVEGILFGVNIPNPKYKFIRFRAYPYRTKMRRPENVTDKEYYEKIVNYRVLPYLMDYKVVEEGDDYEY
jgi:hypothetical protein